MTNLETKKAAPELKLGMPRIEALQGPALWRPDDRSADRELMRTRLTRAHFKALGSCNYVADAAKGLLDALSASNAAIETQKPLMDAIRDISRHLDALRTQPLPSIPHVIREINKTLDVLGAPFGSQWLSNVRNIKPHCDEAQAAGLARVTKALKPSGQRVAAAAQTMTEALSKLEKSEVGKLVSNQIHGFKAVLVVASMANPITQGAFSVELLTEAWSVLENSLKAAIPKTTEYAKLRRDAIRSVAAERMERFDREVSAAVSAATSSDALTVAAGRYAFELYKLNRDDDSSRAAVEEFEPAAVHGRLRDLRREGMLTWRAATFAREYLGPVGTGPENKQEFVIAEPALDSNGEALSDEQATATAVAEPVLPDSLAALVTGGADPREVWGTLSVLSRGLQDQQLAESLLQNSPSLIGMRRESPHEFDAFVRTISGDGVSAQLHHLAARSPSELRDLTSVGKLRKVLEPQTVVTLEQQLKEGLSESGFSGTNLEVAYLLLTIGLKRSGGYFRGADTTEIDRLSGALGRRQHSVTSGEVRTAISDLAELGILRLSNKGSSVSFDVSFDAGNAETETLRSAVARLLARS